MLKAYAMALVLSTATPVADKPADGAKSPIQPSQETTQALRPGTIRI